MTIISNHTAGLHIGADTVPQQHSAKKSYRMFWLFTIGSIAGFLVETVWCLMRYGVLQSRSSLIFGPFNFVYGFGALAMHLCLSRIDRERKGQLFLAGFAVGTAVEYLCSALQEAVFGTVSWDYSAAWFNLNGRVCLLYSVFWGLLAFVWVYVIYPRIDSLISHIPDSQGKRVARCLLVFFLAVSILSCAGVSRWMARSKDLPAKSIVDDIIDVVLPDSYMEIVYPSMMTAGGGDVTQL